MTDCLFGPLKKHLGGLIRDSHEEVEMAIREWLQMKKPDFYCFGIFKLVPRWDMNRCACGVMFEKIMRLE